MHGTSFSLEVLTIGGIDGQLDGQHVRLPEVVRHNISSARVRLRLAYAIEGGGVASIDW